jgi:hypothetical protein
MPAQGLNALMFDAEAGRAVVTNCFQGYNSCVFAYGQTGSGKTYTMLGELAENQTVCLHSGLMPRIFDHLLSELQRRSACPEDGTERKFECHLSMLEIYNETIMDLLNPEACNLAIREDTHQGVYVEALSNKRVHSGAPLAHVVALPAANTPCLCFTRSQSSGLLETLAAGTVVLLLCSGRCAPIVGPRHEEQAYRRDAHEPRVEQVALCPHLHHSQRTDPRWHHNSTHKPPQPGRLSWK